jgi:hypothetical protein
MQKSLCNPEPGESMFDQSFHHQESMPGILASQVNRTKFSMRPCQSGGANFGIMGRTPGTRHNPKRNPGPVSGIIQSEHKFNFHIVKSQPAAALTRKSGVLFF